MVVTFTGSGGADTIVGTASRDIIDGGAGADLIVGGGGSDVLTGGGGADTFKFAAVSDSTTAAPDGVQDFQHGSDLIDLSGGVAGGVVNIVYDGAGDSLLFFAPASDGMSAQGAIFVHGDVTAADLVIEPLTSVVVTGSFAGPLLAAPDLHLSWPTNRTRSTDPVGGPSPAVCREQRWRAARLGIVSSMFRG